MSFMDLAAQNLLSPMVLFFALGLGAALARSDISIPEAVAKVLALYLMLAIGFKGGAELAARPLSPAILGVLVAGAALSFLIPVLAFVLLRAMSRLSSVDAAAVAAHYGSISIVTFVAATETLRGQALPYEAYLVAVAAVMETPAILSALMLARRSPVSEPPAKRESLGAVLREVSLNASVVMLMGSFAIGWITGAKGLVMLSPFIGEPFRGILCLFLLDMGIVAGRGMRDSRKHLAGPLLAFGVIMPLISAAIATLVVVPFALSQGGAALFITLAASASYIAVPAAMRLALPEAKPAIYLTLSLGVTFPFNLAVGIPLYVFMSGLIAS